MADGKTHGRESVLAKPPLDQRQKPKLDSAFAGMTQRLQRYCESALTLPSPASGRGEKRSPGNPAFTSMTTHDPAAITDLSPIDDNPQLLREKRGPSRPYIASSRISDMMIPPPAKGRCDRAWSCEHSQAIRTPCGRSTPRPGLAGILSNGARSIRRSCP